MARRVLPLLSPPMVSMGFLIFSPEQPYGRSFEGQRGASGSLQSAAPHAEAFPHGIEAAAMVVASASMLEHEPGGAQHAARKWKPEVVIEPASGEDAARGGVEDDAGVVLGQYRQRAGERTWRRFPQFLRVEFVQRCITKHAQEHQVSHEVRLNRRQL